MTYTHHPQINEQHNCTVWDSSEIFSMAAITGFREKGLLRNMKKECNTEQGGRREYTHARSVCLCFVLRLFCFTHMLAQWHDV